MGAAVQITHSILRSVPSKLASTTEMFLMTMIVNFRCCVLVVEQALVWPRL